MTWIKLVPMLYFFMVAHRVASGAICKFGSAISLLTQVTSVCHVVVNVTILTLCCVPSYTGEISKRFSLPLSKLNRKLKHQRPEIRSPERLADNFLFQCPKLLPCLNHIFAHLWVAFAVWKAI